MIDASQINIFFIVTTIAVIVVSIGLLIALVYTIRILRDVKRLSRSVRTEGEKIIEDVEVVRHGLYAKISQLLNRSISKVKKKK